MAATTLILWPFVDTVNGNGVAVTALLLMAVLGSAMTWGTGPGLVAAILGTLCLEIFYVGPVTISMHEPVGFACFLLTSVLVGQLSSRAKQRAHEVQTLYERLQASFQQASQLEAARRNERFKTTLLDNLTHDFRTPLTSIMAAATSLMAQKGNGGPSSGSANGSSREELLGVIVGQCGRLDRFIDQMIELAKVEVADTQQDISGEGTPVEDIFAAALSRAEPLLERHHVTVSCQEGLCAIVNPQAIAQVLYSLLENAAKYSPAGTTIRLIATNAVPGLVDVAVEDEGPGIPPHLRDRIFEKFYRADDAADFDTQRRGLGVGLSIANGIMAAHGGRIRVEERPSGARGARFVFAMAAKANKTNNPSGASVI